MSSNRDGAAGASRLDPLAFHAAALTVFLGAAAAPTPLYPLYQATFDLSPPLTTFVFAVYAFALLGAMLVAGALSDHLGRRPVVLIALVVEMAAMALFLVADGPGWLIAARLVQGVATGIAAASIGAALVDVDRARGSLVNALAPPLGMAAGAIGSGALVQHGPWPLHLVYGVLLAAFAVLALAIRRVPETGGTRPGALASLRPRVAIPAGARSALAAITPVNVATWTLGGFYLSLMPSLIAAATGDRAPLTAGLVVAALMLSGAAAIALRRARPAAVNHAAGGIGLAVGILLLLVGVHLASLPALVLGTLVGGAGFGTSFLGSLGTIVPLARPDERAALLSAFYVQSYLAFSVPAILAGYLVQRFGYAATADLYAAAIVGLCLTGLARAALRARAAGTAEA